MLRMRKSAGDPSFPGSEFLVLCRWAGDAPGRRGRRAEVAEKGKEGEAGEDGPLYSLSTAGYLDWSERGVVILFAVVICFQ